MNICYIYISREGERERQKEREGERKREIRIVNIYIHIYIYTPRYTNDRREVFLDQNEMVSHKAISKSYLEGILRKDVWLDKLAHAFVTSRADRFDEPRI